MGKVSNQYKFYLHWAVLPEFVKVQVEILVTALVHAVRDENLRLGKVDDTDHRLPFQSENLPDRSRVQLDGGGQVSQDNVERLGVTVVEQDTDSLKKKKWYCFAYFELNVLNWHPKNIGLP